MAGVKPLLETIGALLPKGIKAWHASPHDFDKVDLGKIGTGQGAQSYGPGFYAAESPAVSGVGGEYWNEFANKMQNDFYQPHEVHKTYALQTLRAAGGDRKKAIDWLEDQIRSYPNDRHGGMHADALEMLRSGEQVGPRVYELNLKADPRSFLQWDEPLSQQPNITQKLPMLLDAAKDEAYNRALSATSKPRQDELYGMVKNPEQATGEFAYRQLAERMRGKEWSEQGPQRVMRTFDMAGIPGVRYLDQVSRQKAADIAHAEKTIALQKERGGFYSTGPEWQDELARLKAEPRTYNYVVNNPDIIEIMRKLAIPGVATGGAASVYQPQGQQ